jgi:hypothetical protein
LYYRRHKKYRIKKKTKRKEKREDGKAVERSCAETYHSKKGSRAETYHSKIGRAENYHPWRKV